MPTQRIHEFDIWRPHYGGATVTVYIAGTTSNASLFSDEALTAAIANPITLSSLTQNAIIYGKFPTKVYTASSYYLDIDGEQTGIQRVGLTTLTGEDASGALVTPLNASVATALNAIIGRVIHAEDYGVMSDSVSATTDATLTAAIGAAAANGGGVVVLPTGSYPFDDLTLSTGVVLQGQGRGVTILQSQTADSVITAGGDRAGLRSLTLDGIDLQAGSIGLYGKAIDEVVLEDVEIKRFETGIHMKGGRRAAFRDLYLDNCVTGAKFHGDNDAGNGADGDEFRENRWVGGKVSNCTTTGVDLSYEDKGIENNAIDDVGFVDNTGSAVRINGARYTSFEDCWWSGNTTVFTVLDDTDTSYDDNTVVGLLVEDCYLNGGAAAFRDSMQDVIFDRCRLETVAFALTVPDNAILFRDCTEDAGVTISGQGTKIVRSRSINKGASTGLTTDATPTVAWSLDLAPGQAVIATASIMAVGTNVVKYAHYVRMIKASRPGSSLDYDAQTSNFTAGQVLTGATSGATAIIQADSDSGATGTLTLVSIVGAFENNETIGDGAGGSATANGTLTGATVVLDQANTIGTDHEDTAGFDADFAANAGAIDLAVTGAASNDLTWTVHVEALTT